MYRNNTNFPSELTARLRQAYEEYVALRKSLEAVGRAKATDRARLASVLKYYQFLVHEYMGMISGATTSAERFEADNVLFVQEPWFGMIRSGEKTVEGRLGDTARFEDWVGGTVRFLMTGQPKNSEEALLIARVNAARHYSSLAEYVAAERPAAVPGAKTDNEAIDAYEAIVSKSGEPLFSPENVEKAGGMVALDFSLIPPPVVADPDGSRGLLVYHQMGLGKTFVAMAAALSAIGAIGHKKSPRRVIFIASKTLHANFTKSLGYYLSLFYGPDESAEKSRAQKLADQFISFVTMNAYNLADQVLRATSIGSLAKGIKENRKWEPGGSDEQLGALDGLLVIVDEAHDFFRAIINSPAPTTNARRLYTMIMQARNLKLMFMTGTPSSKHPFELVPCFNMLAGKEILPAQYDVFERHFIDTSSHTLKNKGILGNRIVGLVSYAGYEIPDNLRPESSEQEFSEQESSEPELEISRVEGGEESIDHQVKPPQSRQMRRVLADYFTARFLKKMGAKKSKRARGLFQDAMDSKNYEMMVANLTELAKLVQTGGPQWGQGSSGQRINARVRAVEKIFHEADLNPRLPGGGKIKHYLDVGAGDGSISAELAEALEVEHFTCVDVRPSAEKEKCERYFQVRDGPLPAADSGPGYDLITLFMSLHHFSYPQTMVDRILAVAAPGAYLVLREYDLDAEDGDDWSIQEREEFLNWIHIMFQCVHNDAELGELDINYQSYASWISFLESNGFRLLAISPRGSRNEMWARTALFQLAKIESAEKESTDTMATPQKPVIRIEPLQGATDSVIKALGAIGSRKAIYEHLGAGGSPWDAKYFAGLRKQAREDAEASAGPGCLYKQWYITTSSFTNSSETPVVGYIGIRPAHAPHREDGQIRYFVSDAYQGQGIGTAAVVLALEAHAECKGDGAIVWSYINPENKASAAIMRKLDFEARGTIQISSGGRLVELDVYSREARPQKSLADLGAASPPFSYPGCTSDQGSMRTIQWKGKTYDVVKAWALSADLPAEEIGADRINIKERSWSDADGGEISPEEALADQDSEHGKRIREADVSYVPLVVEGETEDGPVVVVDGVHRLAKMILLEGRESVPVKFIPEKMLEQLRCSPEPAAVKGGASFSFPERLPMIVEEVEMSEQQYRQYLMARENEASEGGRFSSARGPGGATAPPPKAPPPLALPGSEREGGSSYYVRSRMFSNFAPPREYMPTGSVLDPTSITRVTARDLPEDAFTAATAPKIAQMMKNIEKYPGPFLVYSQFVGLGGLSVVERFLQLEGYERYRPASSQNRAMGGAELGSLDSDSENSDSENSDSENSDSENSDSENSDSENSDSEDDDENTLGAMMAHSHLPISKELSVALREYPVGKGWLPVVSRVSTAPQPFSGILIDCCSPGNSTQSENYRPTRKPGPKKLPLSLMGLARPRRALALGLVRFVLTWVGVDGDLPESATLVVPAHIEGLDSMDKVYDFVCKLFQPVVQLRVEKEDSPPERAETVFRIVSGSGDVVVLSYHEDATVCEACEKGSGDSVTYWGCWSPRSAAGAHFHICRLDEADGPATLGDLFRESRRPTELSGSVVTGHVVYDRSWSRYQIPVSRSLGPQNLESVQGYDECWDCTAEAHTWLEYLRRVKLRLKGNEPLTAGALMNKLTRVTAEPLLDIDSAHGVFPSMTAADAIYSAIRTARRAERIQKRGKRTKKKGGAESAPKYVVITGEVPFEEREAIRKVWVSPENSRGELIRGILTSQTGAQGLDLKYGRQVHILEPYWDKSLEDQVIARFIRIGALDSLPEEERKVQPFLYIAIPNQKMISAMPEDELEVPVMAAGELPRGSTVDMAFHRRGENRQVLNTNTRNFLKTISIECALYGSCSESNLGCRICRPTNAPLFHITEGSGGIEEDLRLPDPCEVMTESRITAKTLKLKLDSGLGDDQPEPVEFKYIEDPTVALGYRFYRRADTLSGPNTTTDWLGKADSYIEVDPSTPLYVELVGQLTGGSFG